MKFEFAKLRIENQLRKVPLELFSSQCSKKQNRLNVFTEGAARTPRATPLAAKAPPAAGAARVTITPQNSQLLSNQSYKFQAIEYELENFQRSNQDTCITHKPAVFEGDWVHSGDMLTDCASSVGGELALGQNLLIAYMPWEGYNFEDAILISERLVTDDLYTSVHIERYEMEIQQTNLGNEEITRDIPDISETEVEKLDSFGIVKVGSWVEEGDILVGKITPIQKNSISPYQKLLYTILEKQVRPFRDTSLRAPKGVKAKVIDIKYFYKPEEIFKGSKDVEISNNKRQNFSSKQKTKNLKRYYWEKFENLNYTLFNNNLQSKFSSEDQISTKLKYLTLKTKMNSFLSTFLNEPSRTPPKETLLRKVSPAGGAFAGGACGGAPSAKQKTLKIKSKSNTLRNFEEMKFLLTQKKDRGSIAPPAGGAFGAVKGSQIRVTPPVKARKKLDAGDAASVKFLSEASGMHKAHTVQKIDKIHIYLAETRKIQVGDKMSGRHGNKGIVSQILPIQDMPYLPDGTPIDMVLNPLGVPSRMNVGQIYECLLGLAGKYLGENYKVSCFDEVYGPDASRSFVLNKLYEARQTTGLKWLFDPNTPGKMRIYDGRTGSYFDQAVTVGRAYMLRLVHMVDDKIHMRSTGPYSLVTQQPLRGRSKEGGQRLGEMEVWALEGYGAAFILLEMLTIKSDDMTGRMTLWSNLILNKEISIGTPESFKVLICELQALCLDIGLFRSNNSRIQITNNQNDKLTEIDSLINLP